MEAYGAGAGGDASKRERAGTGYRRFLAPREEGEDDERGEEEDRHPDDMIEGIQVLFASQTVVTTISLRKAS
jgi:hypothetical protein